MARVQMEGDPNQIADYSPAPAGTYILGVEEIQDGITLQSKLPKTQLVCAVIDGPCKGKKVWHTITWIPKGQPGHGFALAALKAMGLPYEGALDFDTEDIKGRTFRAVLGIEDYQRKDKRTGAESPAQKNVIKEFVTDAAEPMMEAADEFAHAEKTEDPRVKFGAQGVTQPNAPAAPAPKAPARKRF